MAQWLVRRTVERLGGGAVGSIPTVGVCQSTAIFQHIHRLGKPPSAGQHTSSQLSRPIKVQLKSAIDKNWVVSNAKELARASGNSSIRIAQLLTFAELDNLKKLRQDCSSLNMSSSKLSNGKSRYLVINGRIMQRLDDKLAYFDNKE